MERHWNVLLSLCVFDRTEIISHLLAAQHMSENNAISAFDLVGICSTLRGQNCPSWLRFSLLPSLQPPALTYISGEVHLKQA